MKDPTSLGFLLVLLALWSYGNATRHAPLAYQHWRVTVSLTKLRSDQSKKIDP